MVLHNVIGLFKGTILYNEIGDLNEGLPLQVQLDFLPEDLLQIESVDGNYLLDVGWYPEFSPQDIFKVVVIQKYNWEKPLLSKECEDIAALKAALLSCIKMYEF